MCRFDGAKSPHLLIIALFHAKNLIFHKFLREKLRIFKTILIRY